MFVSVLFTDPSRLVGEIVSAPPLDMTVMYKIAVSLPPVFVPVIV